MSGYLDFNVTGVFEIDEISSWLEAAGDAYHHTDGWSEKSWKDDLSYHQHIQASLDNAAKEIQQLREQLAEKRRVTIEEVMKICEDIQEEYTRLEQFKYPELKTDAASGIGDVLHALQELWKTK